MHYGLLATTPAQARSTRPATWTRAGPLTCALPVAVRGPVRVQATVETARLASHEKVDLYLEVWDSAGEHVRQRRFGPTLQRVAHLGSASVVAHVDEVVEAEQAATARVCVHTTSAEGATLVSGLSVRSRGRFGWWRG